MSSTQFYRSPGSNRSLFLVTVSWIVITVMVIMYNLLPFLVNDFLADDLEVILEEFLEENQDEGLDDVQRRELERVLEDFSETFII